MGRLSYGGGIQLTTAAIDCRVDAIVPGIAWHSLETSLYKAETVKTGWSKVLTSTVPKDRLDPHIVSAADSGLRDGSLSDEDRQWFIDRGPGDELVGRIEVPTLLIGGTVDTLFTLDEAITNFELLRANDVPTAMLWFCGGHGTCLTDPGDTDRIATSSFAWLDRYVKGDEGAEALPLLDLVDQDGDCWTSDEWPSRPAWLATEGSGPRTDRRQPIGRFARGHRSRRPARRRRLGHHAHRGGRRPGAERRRDGQDGLVLGSPVLEMTYFGHPARGRDRRPPSSSTTRPASSSATRSPRSPSSSTARSTPSASRSRSSPTTCRRAHDHAAARGHHDRLRHAAPRRHARRERAVDLAARQRRRHAGVTAGTSPVVPVGFWRFCPVSASNRWIAPMSRQSSTSSPPPPPTRRRGGPPPGDCRCRTRPCRGGLRPSPGAPRATPRSRR
ncbi:MAG: hypothetical protein R2711_00700 [Acidimicrobiales bacterium]